MDTKNAIDPKLYETVFVNRQVKAGKGRTLEVGVGHKNLTEDEFKGLRNAGVVCTEKEAKEAGKQAAALKKRRAAATPAPVGGGDASAAAIAECQRIADAAVESCNEATEKLRAELDEFRAKAGRTLEEFADDLEAVKKSAGK